MSPRAKGGSRFALVANMILVAVLGLPGSSGATTIISPSATVEGEVRAIESFRGPPERKEAVVRLSTGEIVRAQIRATSVVEVGKTVKLWRYDHSGIHTY